MSDKDITVAEEVPEDPRGQRALPPPSGTTSEAKGGDHIPRGEGYGSLADPHTSGLPAEEYRGRVDEVNLSEITQDWVLRRLVKEATDFGTRTRQSSRLKALEMIGDYLGMFDKDSGDPNNETDRQRIRDMSPEARQARLHELYTKMKSRSH